MMINWIMSFFDYSRIYGDDLVSKINLSPHPSKWRRLLVALLFMIHCVLLLQLFVWVLYLCLFSCLVFRAISSLATISLRKRELVDLL